jgi:L-fucose mutarotase/ribose pyranase (RbsD/FucU family)
MVPALCGSSVRHRTEGEAMNKTAFIKLLETYKNKAYDNFHAEVRAEALALVPPDLISRMNGMTMALSALAKEHDEVSRLLKSEDAIKALFPKDDYCHNKVMRGTEIEQHNILDYTVRTIMCAIERKEPYRSRLDAIRIKFDEAVARAKKLNSTTALTELARLLEIPLGDDDAVTPDKKVAPALDVKFVKTEIKKAVLLT